MRSILSYLSEWKDKKAGTSPRRFLTIFEERTFTKMKMRYMFSSKFNNVIDFGKDNFSCDGFKKIDKNCTLVESLTNKK